MLPPAPARFSTTNGTPYFACICCCRMRASRSAEPPAANGTTIVTCRCGQSCAAAGSEVARTTTRAVTAITLRIHDLRFVSMDTGSSKSDASSRRQRARCSHSLQVRIPPLVELVVGVAHGLGLAASKHDLEIDRPQAVVLIAVDDAGGTRDALPWAETRGDALAAL